MNILDSLLADTAPALLSSDEVCEALGISRPQLDLLTRNGILARPTLASQWSLFHSVDVKAYLLKRGQR